MENDILRFITENLHPYGYFLIGLLTFLETTVFVGLFIPGDTIVVFSGFLVSRGLLEMPPVIAVAALGAILGDNLGFYLGRTYGSAFLAKFGDRLRIRESHLRRADRFFARFGGASIVLGRFTGYAQTLVPLAAGVSEMKYRVFLLFSLLGGVLWAAAMTLIGYFFGISWTRIREFAGTAGAILLAAALLAFIVYRIVRARRRR